MSQLQTATTSSPRGIWENHIFFAPSVGSVKVFGGLTRPEAPSIESLERRYEASDKSWIEAWLQDEVDPCSPE